MNGASGSGGALDRWRVLLAAAWAGALLTVATVATPAPFATLAAADAGRVVARVLASEAYGSLVLGVLLLLLERRSARAASDHEAGSQFSTGMALCLGAIFCTVLGYFAVQPMLTAARAGQAMLTFAQLHMVSVACFGLKGLLVLALAWRAAAPAVTPSSS